jgi:hypothetical protein
MGDSGIEAYPLAWPQGWARTPTGRRESGAFKTTFAKARDELMAEISRLGGRHPVLSSNLELRRDGLPYASRGRVEDPGIAVYFDYKGSQMCFACDRYSVIDANTQAIRLSIAAIRGLERWGASDMMERAFAGFAALGHDAGRKWWDVLGIASDAPIETVRVAYQFCAVETAWQNFTDSQP